MLHILLPTDLSDQALRTAELSIGIFGTEGVDYTLLHTYYEAAVADPMLPSTTAAMHKAAEEALVEHERSLRQRLGAVEPTLRRLACFGPLSSAIDREAREARADLVVMYTGDHSGHGFLGSNTTDVIRHGHVPVLEIPPGDGTRSIHRILFADDRSAIDKNALAMLALIAERTGSEVIVAHIATGRPAYELVDNTQLVSDALKGAALRTVMVEDDDVVEALLDIAARERIDLIAALHRDKGLFNALFKRSTTKRLALASAIPVLALEE